MTFLPVQLPPGIVRGANPDDMPGRWYDGSLIRWRQGIMEPVGGWARVTTTPLGSTPRRIDQWKRNTGATMTLVGCDTHLYADNSGTFVNVAPADLTALTASTSGGYGASSYGTSSYGTPRTGATSLSPKRETWSMSNWGEDVLAVASSDGRLFYFSSASPSTTVTTVGVYAISSISRTSNVTTVTTTAAHNLATSDVVKIAGVTDTTFNTTSASVTVTGSTTFTYANTGTNGTSTGGTVTDISVPTGIRGVLVSPERHVLLLQPGGNQRRVGWSSREDYTDFNFSSTTNTAGYLDLQSETALISMSPVREGTLIWSSNRAFLLRYVGTPFVYGADELGTTRLYAPNAYAEFEGKCAWMDSSGFSFYEGGSIRPLPCPLNDYVFSNIDPVWGPIRTHAVVNGKFNEVWWFYPSVGSTECNRLVIWNYSEDWWSLGLLDRTAAFPANVTDYPLMTGTDKHLYQHESGWTYASFDFANNIFVTSSTINLPGAEQAMSISQVVPSNGSNYDRTNYSFFTRMTPGGAERSFGPYLARADGYVDTRVMGRDVRIKINANVAGDWSIGRLRLKVGSAGGRR